MEVKTLSQFKSKLQGGGARFDPIYLRSPFLPSPQPLVETGHRVMTGENGTFRFLCRPHNSQPPLLE